MSDLVLGYACKDDMDFLFQLRNDIEVRNNFFNTQVIQKDEHKIWFKNMMENKNQKQFILKLKEKKIGQIRIDLEDLDSNNQIWGISYSIIQEYRGNGYAKKMLQLLEEELKGGNVVLIARVKSDNHKSQHVFRSLDYDELNYGCEYRKKLLGDKNEYFNMHD